MGVGRGDGGRGVWSRGVAIGGRRVGLPERKAYLRAGDPTHEMSRIEQGGPVKSAGTTDLPSVVTRAIC